jgi:flagellar motor switch protein FliM
MDRETTCQLGRPDSMTLGQLGQLRRLHEGMIMDCSAELSVLMRATVEVSIARVEQLTYGEFVAELESPTCLNVLKAEPLGDRLMLDIERPILYPMIDRLLGGAADNEPPPRRPLSDIEVSLAARITRLFLKHLDAAWKKWVELKLDVLQVESDGRSSRILSSDEPLVLVAFQVNVGQSHGLIRLAIPCRAVRQIHELCQVDGSSDSQQEQPGGAQAVLLEVVLAISSIGSEELASLRVGDIIATETAADAPAIVSIDGKPRFHASAGLCEGRKAIRLLEPITEPADEA